MQEKKCAKIKDKQVLCHREANFVPDALTNLEHERNSSFSRLDHLLSSPSTLVLISNFNSFRSTLKISVTCVINTGARY